jgi:YD repeat-containing protein
VTRYSDLAGGTVVATTAYGYDNANQLTAITDKTGVAATQHLNPELIEDINRTIAQLQQQINRIWGIGGGG